METNRTTRTVTFTARSFGSATVHAADSSRLPGRMILACNGRAIEGSVVSNHPQPEDITCKACIAGLASKRIVAG